MISIIVAADKNRAIGAKNRIPWRLSHDRVLLKNLTLDHTVILGRKSYDSMVWYYDKSGRPMPGKVYIVVTRNADYKPARDNARVAYSVGEALEVARSLGDETIQVIGGGEIFKAALPMAERIYYVEVDTIVEEPDAHFPVIDKDEWAEASRQHHPRDERNEYDSELVVFERK